MRVPIFDGHNDTLTRIFLSEQNEHAFLKESKSGQLDLKRAHKGGVFGGLFAVFVPPPEASPERDPNWGFTLTENGYDVRMPSAIEQEYAYRFTSEVFRFANKLEKKSSEKLKIVRNFDELEKFPGTDRLAVVLHIEGAAAIDKELENLESLYEQGLRSLGLVWSRPNIFGEGVPFRFPHSPDTGSGLSSEGRELVKACNSLGIMVDLAHVNEKGFWDVAELTSHPIVVSHTAVHSICASTRNLTDDQIFAVAESNGVVGVIFEPCNTRSDGLSQKNSSLSQIVHHIDYLLEKVGVDYVALGSDFDGAEMPVDLKDASECQHLVQALRGIGVGEEDLVKICYRNWFRVMKKTWR